MLIARRALRGDLVVSPVNGAGLRPPPRADRVADGDPALRHVPPQRRLRPYTYSAAEITDLLAAMPALQPAGLQGRTYECFFGLIATADLHFSEATGLRREDVDLAAGVLTIRETKFGKTRLIPLHASTADVLSTYAMERDRCGKRRSGAVFFIGDRGAKLNHSNAHRTFIDWTRQAGIRGVRERNGPRVHDLRHTLAVRTLLGWYQAGEDVDRRLPALTTYLGHIHTEDTYWYLTACPELLDHARHRLEARWETAA